MDLNRQPAAHSAGNSRGWTSYQNSGTLKYKSIHNLGSHLKLKRSPFFPQDAAQYVMHVTLYKTDKKEVSLEAMKKSLADKQSLQNIEEWLSTEDIRNSMGFRVAGEQYIKESKFFKDGKFTYDDGKTAFFAQPSIWATGAEKDGGRADWPCKTQNKEYGEDKIAVRLPRQLPPPLDRKVAPTSEYQAWLINQGIPEEYATGLEDSFPDVKLVWELRKPIKYNEMDVVGIEGNWVCDPWIQRMYSASLSEEEKGLQWDHLIGPGVMGYV